MGKIGGDGGCREEDRGCGEKDGGGEFNFLLKQFKNFVSFFFWLYEFLSLFFCFFFFEVV